MQTMELDFETHTRRETVVYDTNGLELARVEGFVEVSPKDYEGWLPIEYRHIETSTRVVSAIVVESRRGDWR